MDIRGLGTLARKDNKDGGLAKDASAAGAGKRKRSDAGRDANVGAALRSVYTETVNEAIPSEFLDLLRKLD
jgi:hypothetical protein